MLKIPLKTQLSILFTLLIGGISLFILLYIPNLLEKQVYSSLVDKYQTLTDLTASAISPEMGYEDRDEMEDDLSGLKADTDVLYIVIINDSNKIISSYHLDIAEEIEYLTTQSENRMLKGEEFYATGIPIINEGQSIGKLFIGYSLENLHKQVAETRNTIGIICGLLFIVGVIIVFSVSAVLTRPLQHIVEASDEIAGGNLTKRADERAQSEIGKLARSFNTMVNNLISAQNDLMTINQTLEQRISERTEKLSEEIATREKAEEQLRNFSLRLQTVREDERAWIAREIHDQLGQSLTGMKMYITGMLNSISTSTDEEVKNALSERLTATSQLIDETITSVQRISTELRPDILDKLGLVAALDWHSQEFQSHFGIACELTTELDDSQLHQQTTIALYRIVQEALTNVARHSGATRVTILLVAEDQEVYLELRDNGKGITEEEINKPTSLGIIGIRERVASLRGEVLFSGVPGSGTTLSVRVPFS